MPSFSSTGWPKTTKAWSVRGIHEALTIHKTEPLVEIRTGRGTYSAQLGASSADLRIGLKRDADMTSVAKVRNIAIALTAGCGILLLVATNSPNLHRNDEFGLKVSFPDGGKVCVASSGDHPHGFYAWYGGRQTDCGSTNADPSASVLSIYASYNTTFEASPRQVLSEACRRGSASSANAIDLGGLSIPELASDACSIQRPDGSLEIEVGAQGGELVADGTAHPRINYSASLITRLDRVDRDLAMFREFLSGINVTAN